MASNPVLELLGDSLRSPDGQAVPTADALGEAEVLGIYFSAHWCPPCRGFTPKLGERYSQLKEAGKKLEVVFVSSDRDESAFTEYHDSMPFFGMPFSRREEKAKLSERFGVNGIPTLVFVDAKTGALITDEGRAGVSSPTFLEEFPYHPKPVNDVGTSISGINNKSSLVVLMEAVEKTKRKAILEALTEVAEEEMKAEESERAVQRFFTGTDDGPLEQIRKMGGLPPAEKPSADGEATMLIFDLSENGAVYAPLPGKENVSADNMAAFIKDFQNKALKKVEKSQSGA
jgi:thiol-disulfide isomerase/thioredoxin